MRILRGTGLSGLSAIFPKRTIGKTVFIRPLLETPRSLIERFLKRKGVAARIDPSNGRDFFMRNKIRHRLLPELKQSYNKNIINILANLAQTAADDYQYLEQAAHNSLKGSPSRLNLKKLAKLHPAILRLKLRQGIAAVQGDTRRISFVHIRELEDLISDRPHGSIVHLPKRICVQKTRTYLRFYKR
jgi:tRNA(Ile)-lysidine synthase